MQQLKLIWIVIVLLFLSTKSYATYTAIGCVSDDTGYLYTGSAGVNSPRYGGYGPAYETTPVVTTGQIGTGIYCNAKTLGNCVIRTKTRCTECTGPYDYQAGYGTNYYYEQAGKLKGFMLCPIDDYVGLMVIAMGGLGFVAIRKKSLVFWQ